MTTRAGRLLAGPGGLAAAGRLGVVLLTFVPGLLFYGQLPAQIPIHWGIGGVANRFTPKLPGILLAPATATKGSPLPPTPEPNQAILSDPTKHKGD